ncbi:MAG: hypothetical protein O3B21_07200 [Proteobacteria bacterium]|nr:hypothetical protein [Pseudomonadota bacterium]MDA1356850.1 hypothetical protein [Pseudomonadota bacterium]
MTTSSAKLGALVKTVTRCDQVPPWEFDLTVLMRNLARRSLLNS